MPESRLNPAHTLCAALALELSAPAAEARALPRLRAGELARLIARDLAGIEVEVSALSMSTVGAHYDPVELLRPGWPLFTELDQLSARAPGRERAQVVAFGTRDGALPGALTPAAEHLGGPLRVLPLLLRGEADDIARVRTVLEQRLIEDGMAAADTALMAQDAFAVKIEHARYLTLHDLCALTALQYEHAGLAPLWPLIETALFSPMREVWLDAPPEPLLGWCAGEARMVEFGADAWRQRYAADLDASEAARLHRHFCARQKQLAAVLAAHGVHVRPQSFSTQ